MAKNIIKIIKEQVDRQTAKHLNTDLSNVPIVGYGNEGGTPRIGGDIVLSPSWTRGYYSLGRDTGLTVDDFIKTSSKITWDTTTSQINYFSDLTNTSNNLFGVQLFTDKAGVSISFSLISIRGYLRIYKRDESSTVWTEVLNINEDYSSDEFKIYLTPHQWNTIIITFYALGSSTISFSSNYYGASSWRYLDITAPNIPTWSTPPITFSIVDPALGRTKLTLKWAKDNSIGLGGNGIYKQTTETSGYTTAFTAPTALLSNEYNNSLTEPNKWLGYFGTIGTINTGDIISFSSEATQYSVSRVLKIRKNYVANPIFNSNDNWVFVTGTIKSTPNRVVGDNYYNIGVTATNDIYTLTSATISVDRTLEYYAQIKTSSNLLSNYPYGLGGYGITPSRWDVSANLTVVATKYGTQQRIQIVRAGSGFIRTEDNAFYVSTVATYSLVCSASFVKQDAYKIYINDSSTDATLYSTPSLYNSFGYGVQYLTFTPSASASVYLKLTIPATTSTTSFATLEFNPILLEGIHRNVDFDEKFIVYYYDQDHVACPSPTASFNIGQSCGVNSRTVHFATLSTIFPATCSFIKLGYKLDINTTATPLYFNRNIYSISFTDTVPEGREVFATQSVWIRTTATVSCSVSDSIKYSKFEHIYDRPRQGDDGAIIAWDDYAVVDNTLYYYYIDAYDTSSFKNRSAFSVVASLTSGDTTAPKRPSGYSLTAYNGGIQYSWTNPTATDFSHVRCYSDVGLTNVSFELYGKPNVANSYSEMTAGVAVASRYLTAFDRFGNESFSTLATITTQEEILTDLGFSVVIRNTAKVKISPNENGWYNSPNVVASLVYIGSSPIASYFYSSSWGLWNSFNGLLGISGDGDYNFLFRIKDIYDNYSVPSDVFSIRHDKTTPTWSASKYGYWSANSVGLAGYNKLLWDNSKITDATSGKAKTHIRKAEFSPYYKNVNFEYGVLGGTPEGYLFVDVANKTNSGITESKFFNGKRSFKIAVDVADSNSVFLFQNIPNSLADTEKLCAYVRYCIPTLSSSASMGIGFYNKGGLLSETKITVSESSDWKYAFASYTRSGATATVKVVYTCSNDNGVIGDTHYIDEFVTYKESGAVFATIDSVAKNVQEYYDNDVEPWKHYLYYTVIEDVASNYSTKSHYKYLSPVVDYKDSFRNMLDNSSFERTYYTGNGTLQAYGWEGLKYSTTPLQKEYAGVYALIVDGNAYSGNVYMRLPSTYLKGVYQNDIHLLPFVGETRKYVYSFYAKEASGGGIGIFHIKGYDNESQLVKEKVVALTSVPAAWNRYTGTFYVSTPSITHISVGFLGASTHVIDYDAVQFEEKDSLPPTDYYDTKSITADYLQGNLIRGHMIEANSIVAENIKADTITTNELKLLGANIYSKNILDGGIDLNGSFTSGGGTIGNIYITLATNSITGWPQFNYAANIVQGGRNNILVGRINTALNDGGNVNVCATVLYTYDMTPLISKPYPFDGSKYGILLVSKNKFGDEVPTIWSSFASLSVNPHMDQKDHFSAASNIVATRTDMSLGALKYYNNKFYYMAPKYSAGVEKYKILVSKISAKGTLLASYVKVVGDAYTNMYHTSFDISAGGTLRTTYSTGATYIHYVSYSTIGEVVTPTIHITTYSGFHNSGYPSAGKAPIYNCAIARATLDEYIIAYTINQQLFYKVIDGSGGVLVGSNSDLFVSSTKIHPDYPYNNDYSGWLQIAPRMLTTFSGNVLCYLPATPLTTPNNTGIAMNTSIGGRAVYFSRVTPTVSLIDFLNRIA